MFTQKSIKKDEFFEGGRLDEVIAMWLSGDVEFRNKEAIG